MSDTPNVRGVGPSNLLASAWLGALTRTLADDTMSALPGVLRDLRAYTGSTAAAIVMTADGGTSWRPEAFSGPDTHRWADALTLAEEQTAALADQLIHGLPAARAPVCIAIRAGRRLCGAIMLETAAWSASDEAGLEIVAALVGGAFVAEGRVGRPRRAPPPSVGPLLRTLAHDLRNQLSVLINGSELAREELEDVATGDLQEVYACLDDISRAADATHLLATQLSTLGSVLAVRTTRINPARVVSGGEDRLQALVDPYGLEITLVAGCPDVLGDAAVLEGLLRDLVICGGEGGVAIRCAPCRVSILGGGPHPDMGAGTWVAISVTLPHPDGAAPDLKGLCLRLALAAVQTLEGQLVVRTLGLRSTSVTTYLPSEDVQDRRQTADALVQSQVSACVTVLLLDSDPLRCAGWRAVLEAEGHRVLAAARARVGLVLAERRADQIDVVLCSASLPDGDPAGVLASVRARNPSAALVTLVLGEPAGSHELSLDADPTEIRSVVRAASVAAPAS